MIGDGSNLKVGKLENTAAAIGTTGSGKLSIDEYVGHDLENVDKLKTVGGSVGISASGITSLGVNYSDKKQEGITKNTVIGNVEIGKSSGDEINRDLDTMTEITEDRDFKTDINIESQTINYIKNPEKFKEDLQKAKNEVEDLENAVKNTSNPLGKDKRNIFANLRAQRWSTSYYNVIGSRVEELGRQFKAGTINEDNLKEAVRDIVKGYGKDIGIDFDVVYLDEKTMPKDSEGSTGSSYIVDRKNRKVLIPIDVNKIEDIKEVLGTLTEEVAHGKDALEGRQDKKVAEDKSNDEEGLESLGRPANEYVKKKFGEDNNSKIKLTTDGIDLSNADVGEKVGDVVNENYEIATFSSAGIDSAGVGLIGIGGLSLSSENNEYIKKVTIEVKEKLSKFGNNVKNLYAVAKTLIEKKLREKGIIADVKITEDKNGNVSYTVYPLDKGNKRNSKLSNSSGTNISKASSSNNSDKKNENKEENINKDDKGSEDNKDNKEPNNEEKKPTPKNEDDSDIGLKIGAGTGAAYEIKSGIKNSNNKNTTSTAQENSNKNANPSNQRGQVSQSNKNNANKAKAEESNQQVSKGATSNKQQGAPVSKTSDTNKSGIVTNATQKAISANTKQNVNSLIISNGTLNNGTKYVVIESSSEKIKSVDELLTKEGQAKLPNTSLKELEIIAQKEGYGTQFISNTKGSGNGQRLIITGHKSIGSIRSNSEGTHEMVYKVVSGNFKDINNNPLPGKIKVLEGKPEEYHTRGNTPEKAELIFVEKRRK